MTEAGRTDEACALRPSAFQSRAEQTITRRQAQKGRCIVPSHLSRGPTFVLIGVLLSATPAALTAKPHGAGAYGHPRAYGGRYVTPYAYGGYPAYYGGRLALIRAPMATAATTPVITATAAIRPPPSPQQQRMDRGRCGRAGGCSARCSRGRASIHTRISRTSSNRTSSSSPMSNKLRSRRRRCNNVRTVRRFLPGAIARNRAGRGVDVIEFRPRAEPCRRATGFQSHRGWESASARWTARPATSASCSVSAYS